MKKFLFIISLQLLTVLNCKPQSPANLTLQECQQLAEQNYPLVKRYDLIRKMSEYTIANIQKGNLPQLTINAQATYQSAVTSIPIHLPNVDIPTVSKDQYKAYAEVNQAIYNGGETARQKELQKSNEVLSEMQLKADLYQLRDRVNQLFFGVLLLDEQLKQNSLLTSDLQSGLKKTQALLNNGTSFRSNADILSAEILGVEQRNIELHASRTAYITMLGGLTGKTLDENTILIKPETIQVSANILRPELAIFDAQTRTTEAQDRLLTVSTKPRLGLFVQGGYGRPALNLLNNNFTSYYIGGLRFSWSPSVFYTLKKKREQLNITRQEIAVQKEAFLFNTNLTVLQQNEEIHKYQQLCTADDQIIVLRQKVKQAAMAQLENGVLTSIDFLKQVNDEDRARQNKVLHEIQLLLAQYKQQTTTGNLP